MNQTWFEYTKYLIQNEKISGISVIFIAVGTANNVKEMHKNT